MNQTGKVSRTQDIFINVKAFSDKINAWKIAHDQVSVVKTIKLVIEDFLIHLQPACSDKCLNFQKFTLTFGEFDKTEEHNKIKDMDKNLTLFNLNCKTKLPHKYLVNMVLGDHLLWLLGFVGRDPSPFKTTQIKNSDKLGAKKKRKSANVFTLILNLGENNEFGFWCGRSVTGEVVYITEHFIQATEGKEDNV